MERLDVVRVGNNCRAFRPPGSPPLSGPHPYLPNKNSRGFCCAVRGLCRRMALIRHTANGSNLRRHCGK